MVKRRFCIATRGKCETQKTAKCKNNSPVYRAQTNQVRPTIVHTEQITKTRVHTKLGRTPFLTPDPTSQTYTEEKSFGLRKGRTRVSFSHACAVFPTPQSLIGERTSAHVQNRN